MKSLKTKKTMMLVAAISALTVCLLALCACGVNAGVGVVFSIDSDADGIHVVAENGSDSSGSEKMTVESGSELVITPEINKGSFEVKVTNSADEVVFEKEITDNTIFKTVPVEGEVEVEVQAVAADGTLEISQAVGASAGAEK